MRGPLFAALIVCIAGISCGKSVSNPSPVSPGPSAAPLRLDRFLLRFQTGGTRFIELVGDSASLYGASRVDMDTADLSFFRDNLLFIQLKASAAQARVGEKDSGVFTLEQTRGTLYYGGALTAPSMRISIPENLWTAAGPVHFSRPPLEINAQSAGGPLSLNEILARDARIQTDESSAQGDKMFLNTRDRTILLQGNASYKNDTSTRTAHTLILQLDPSFSRLSPVSTH